MIDYYQILQISFPSSEREIKHAYYKLAKQYHPDKPLGNHQFFLKIQKAYTILSDPVQKKTYDKIYEKETQSPLNLLAQMLLESSIDYFLRQLQDNLK